MRLIKEQKRESVGIPLPFSGNQTENRSHNLGKALEEGLVLVKNLSQLLHFNSCTDVKMWRQKDIFFYVLKITFFVRYYCKHIRVWPASYLQGKGTLFRNIQNRGDDIILPCLADGVHMFWWVFLYVFICLSYLYLCTWLAFMITLQWPQGALYHFWCKNWNTDTNQPIFRHTWMNTRVWHT